MDANEHTIRQFIEQITPGQRNAITVAQTLAKDMDGTDIPKLSLEFGRTVTPPVRMESRPRAHQFYDAAGFSAYLAENTPDNGKLVVLIDTENLIAKAVLDDTARHGFEVITFQPPYHPSFTLIKTLLLKTQTVAEFANAAMRCRKNIVAVNGTPDGAGSQLTMLLRQITVSNQVTMESGIGNGAVNGVLLKTNIKAGQTADTKIDLPEQITVQAPVFLTGSPVCLMIQLTIQPNLRTESVMICAEVPELEVIVHDEFEKMLADLHQMDGALISFGRIAFNDWNYCE